VNSNHPPQILLPGLVSRVVPGLIIFLEIVAVNFMDISFSSNFQVPSTPKHNVSESSISLSKIWGCPHVPILGSGTRYLQVGEASRGVKGRERVSGLN
jgi:hypothetical protein